MTPDPVFLTVEQVVRLHQRLVERYGGDPGLLSMELLESAVMMPIATFDGQMLHESLAAMAAAYLFHLCRNHPFADGNRRIALAAAELFVLANGQRLRATNRELEQITRHVAEGVMPKHELVRWFEARVEPAER